MGEAVVVAYIKRNRQVERALIVRDKCQCCTTTLQVEGTYSMMHGSYTLHSLRTIWDHVVAHSGELGTNDSETNGVDGAVHWLKSSRSRQRHNNGWLCRR